MTSSVPAIVVGAGISGLACAYALRKAGVDALVVESSARAGGMICSQRRDGYLLELGPQSFSGAAALRALCGGLGIADQVLHAPAGAPRYVLINGALQAVPLTPPAMLTSSLLSASTKWKIAWDAFGSSQPPEGDESIAEFVRRKFGAELLERLAGPFVSGVYAGDPERLSLQSAFPQVREAEESAGSVIRGMIRAARARKGRREKPTLLSFREGNETLVRALAAKIGAGLRLSSEVAGIQLRREQSKARFEVRIRSAGKEDVLITERLVMAAPAEVAGALLRDVNAAFEPVLCGIEYAPVAVVSLGYILGDVDHSLEGFGFLVPRSSGLRVLGTVWNSSLFPDRTPDGYALLTSFVGGATDPQAIALPATALASLVHGEIAPLLRIGAAPEFINVQIYPRALPQYNIGHRERLAALDELQAQTPGLFFVGNYLQGPAIGACVEQATEVAERLRASA